MGNVKAAGIPRTFTALHGAIKFVEHVTREQGWVKHGASVDLQPPCLAAFSLAWLRPCPAPDMLAVAFRWALVELSIHLFLSHLMAAGRTVCLCSSHTMALPLTSLSSCLRLSVWGCRYGTGAAELGWTLASLAHGLRLGDGRQPIC